MDGEAWWATVHGAAKSRTRLSSFTFTYTCMSFPRFFSITGCYEIPHVAPHAVQQVTAVYLSYIVACICCACMLSRFKHVRLFLTP